MQVDIREKYAALAEAFRDCAIYALDPEGMITSWSDGAQSMGGYRPDEVLNRNVSMLYAPEDVEEGCHKRNLKAAAEHGRSEEESWRIRKDGSRIWGHSVIVAMRDQDGQVESFFNVTRDLTERKRAEESKEKLEAQILHAQKLESLGVLAGGIAHDFANLLVSILGHSGLALMELPPEAPARRTVEMIESAAMRAAELTKQLLAYSGKGAFVIQPINLSRLVQEMSHLLGVSISKKSSFVTNLPDDLPSIEADAVQMQQVVMNLITNASEAIGDKAGSISVRTGGTDVDRYYLSGTCFDEELPEGHYVYLEVSDTGCGIDPETKRRIFDPFFTTKSTGHGLGLAAVLGIVRGHRGTISVYSEVGHGTTFKMLFPSSDKKATPEVTQEMESSRAWRGSGTILVVDDEEGVRVVARTALEKSGFTVLTAEDGLVGLQLFRKRADDICLVLLDMTMPRMSGDEVFRELLRISPGLRVILSSGYNEQDATGFFAGKRLAGFIQKPYQPLALINKIRQTLEAGGQAKQADVRGQGGAASGGV